MAVIMKPENDMSKMNCPPMGKCIPQETAIRNVRLAAAYVPYNYLCNLFPPIEALKNGTVFPELFSPYEGKDIKYKHKGTDKRGEYYGE